MEKIKCFENDFMLDYFCENCRYFDSNMGLIGGCLKSDISFWGFTNIFECEDFCYDTSKRV